MPDAKRQANPGGAARRSGAARIPGLILLACALPGLLLALAALTGIGLHQNLSALQSLLVAATLVTLPALGLASLFGSGTAAHGWALLGWSLAVLLTLPAYHPGARESATAEGLLLIAAPLGEDTAHGIAEAGRTALGWLGPEAPRPQAATPISEGRKLLVSEGPALEPAAGSDEWSRGDDETQRPAAEPPRRPEPRRNPLPLAIPYEGDAASLRIPVAVDGPDYGEELTMIFDTGATLTTLNRHTLDLLEIPLPADAPVIKLQTAAGEIEAPLVLADAVWLGNEVVEWVTIAVCEPCARDGVAGLLGLNVSGQFHVSIDHDAQLLELRPRGQRTNRKVDIGPWLDLRSQLTQWNDGRIEIDIEAHNRARQEIRSTVLEVECMDERFAVRLYGIPAEGSIRESASLARGSDCTRYRIHTFAADWLLDRF